MPLRSLKSSGNEYLYQGNGGQGATVYIVDSGVDRDIPGADNLLVRPNILHCGFDNLSRLATHPAGMGYNILTVMARSPRNFK